MPGESQINNSLYFMPGVPQSNRINPAHQPNCNFYLGLPGVSPLRTNISSSSLAYGDLIYPHPSQDSLITFLHPLGSKQPLLDLLQPVNFILSELGVSLLSVGFRTGIGFFSFDVTTRVEGSINYPGDLARLMLNGALEGETYLLDGIGAEMSVFDEISLGWSGTFFDNLTVGARAKALFGVANLSTTNSELSVFTSQDVWNIQSNMLFKSSIPFAEVTYADDGMLDEIILDEELENFDPTSFSNYSLIRDYAFNSMNFGLGVDIGVDYRPIDKLLVSASVLDLGYVNWKDGVNDVSYQMEYDFTGLEINPFQNPDDLSLGDQIDSSLTQLTDSLSNFLTFTPGGAYSKRLNTKLFVGASFSLTPKISFGVLSRTDFLSEDIAQQFTASANLTTGRFANLSLSYSYINSYYKNIGAGVSFNVGPLNMYLISDNLLNAVIWPQEARSMNLWFGLNLVFGYKKFMNKESTDRPLVY